MKKLIIFSIFYLLLLSKSFALENETVPNNKWYNNFYLGIGASSINNDFKYGIAPLQLYYEPTKKKAIDFFVGYDLMEYLALEINYSNMMQTSYTDYDDAFFIENSDINYHGYNLSFYLIPKYTFKNKHVIFTKLGISLENLNFDSDATHNNQPIFSNQYTNFIKYSIGIGYEYKITSHHSVLTDVTYSNILFNYSILAPKNADERPEVITTEYRKSKKFSASYKYSF